MFFELEKVTGFFCRAPFVEVKDANTGRTFYYFENLNEDRITFNLPAGEYTTQNDIFKLERPLKYVCPPLKMRVLFLREPKDMKIEVGDNPNKCSVWLEEGRILLDHQFVKRELPFLVFILNHERGHYRYRSEEDCDTFAASEMLKIGYNPSQCYYANALCLSKGSEKRKEVLHDFLKRVKTVE